MNLTRQDIYNKLESFGDITQSEMLTQITDWLNELGVDPNIVINDLLSYKVYADAKQ